MSCCVILVLPWDIIKQKTDISGLGWTSVLVMSIRVTVLEAYKSTYPSLCITAVSNGNGKAGQSRDWRGQYEWKTVLAWESSAPWSLKKSGRKGQTGTDEKAFATIYNAVGPTKFIRWKTSHTLLFPPTCIFPILAAVVLAWLCQHPFD